MRKVTKKFKEIVYDLEVRSNKLTLKIRRAKSFNEVEKLKIKLNLQLTKIEFLKKGYNLKCTELRQNQQLG